MPVIVVHGLDGRAVVNDSSDVRLRRAKLIEDNIEFVDLLEKHGSRARPFMSSGHVLSALEDDNHRWVIKLFWVLGVLLLLERPCFAREDLWGSNASIINPLSPSSDQHHFSPNNIHRLSRDRLWELIKWSVERNCLDLLSNSLNSFFKEIIEISLEKLYMDVGT